MSRFTINREAYDQLPPEKRVEVDRYLAQLEEEFERNPLNRYQPHAKQAAFHASHDNIKAFLGGNRAGKTTCGIVDDVIQAVDRNILPTHLQAYKRWEPPFYCRILTPDFTSTMEGVIFVALRKWLPASQLAGGSWDTAYSKANRILHLANGSWFQFQTFEQDVDKLGGAALHRVHYDEEPPLGHRTECRARLVDYGGDEVFTMTPLMGMTWLYEAVYERRHEPGITVVQASMTENPYLDQGAMDEFLASLTEEERKARRDGKFVHFAGLIYSEFSGKHVIEPVSPSFLDGKFTMIGIDPGIRNTAVVFGAFDNDNDLMVFDELFLNDATVEQVASAIHLKLNGWKKGLFNFKPYFVIDPSARNRSAVNAENVEGEFARFGVYPTHGQNDVSTGILNLKRRLQRDVPGLLVAKNCERLLWEFGRYRWQDMADGSSVPLKVDDHALDALRYVAMTRPWLQAPQKANRFQRLQGTGQTHINWEPPWKPENDREYGPMGALS